MPEVAGSGPIVVGTRSSGYDDSDGDNCANGVMMLVCYKQAESSSSAKGVDQFSWGHVGVLD